MNLRPFLTSKPSVDTTDLAKTSHNIDNAINEENINVQDTIPAWGGSSSEQNGLGSEPMPKDSGSSTLN